MPRIWNPRVRSVRVGASGPESEGPIDAGWYLGAGIRGTDRYRVMPRGGNPRVRSVRVGASGLESEGPIGTE